LLCRKGDKPTSCRGGNFATVKNPRQLSTKTPRTMTSQIAKGTTHGGKFETEKIGWRNGTSVTIAYEGMIEKEGASEGE